MGIVGLIPSGKFKFIVFRNYFNIINSGVRHSVGMFEVPDISELLTKKQKNDLKLWKRQRLSFVYKQVIEGINSHFINGTSSILFIYQ